MKLLKIKANVNLTLSVTLLLLAGCTSRSDVSESNFAEIIKNKYYSNHTSLCFSLSTKLPISAWDLSSTNQNTAYANIKTESQANQFLDSIVTISAINMNINKLHEASYVVSNVIDMQLSDKAGNLTENKVKVNSYMIDNTKWNKYFKEDLAIVKENANDYLKEFYKNATAIVPIEYGDIQVSELDNFVKAGLISKKLTGQFITKNIVTGEPMNAVFQQYKYELSELGKSHFSEKEGFCYGNVSFEKIDKWFGPKKLGDYQEVDVTYIAKTTYENWAKDKKMSALFPTDNFPPNDTSNKRTITMVLSSKGWEVKE